MDYYSLWAKEVAYEEKIGGIDHSNDYHPLYLDTFFLPLGKIEDVNSLIMKEKPLQSFVLTKKRHISISVILKRRPA